LVAGCARSGSGEHAPVFVVVSGDTAGWITPCGCASNQSGGLPRRGSYVAELRKSGAVALVDVGGAPGGVSTYQRLKFETLLAGTRLMSLAAHNIGAAEARLGAAYLRELARAQGVPFISANVRDAAGALVAEPLRVVAVGGRQVAFIGVLSPQLAPPDVRVDDPREAVLRALDERKAGRAEGRHGGRSHSDDQAHDDPSYDVLIVLAYLPEPELRDFAGRLPEADAVIGGPTGQPVPIQQIGPTLLSSATNKGKFLVQLGLPSRGSAGRLRGEIVELSERFGDDVDQERNLVGYLAKLAARDFSAAEAGFAPPQPAGAPAEFRVAGTETCRACHESEWTTWKLAHHAAAWQSLKDRGYHVEPYCQQCHTTAYGQPGGFLSASGSPDRLGVGCETCHGPAAAHVGDPNTPTPFVPNDQCVRCHDHENSPRFEYATYWPRIEHGPRAASAPATTTVDAEPHEPDSAGGS
ncbi:MAG: multiheme c-type cytochrome, partial [Planctomycetota bacterium]